MFFRPIFFFVLSVMLCASVYAHEFRPGHLRLVEDAGSIHVTFKQPVFKGLQGRVRGMNLHVIVPESCERSDESLYKQESVWVQRFRIPCDLKGPDDVIRIQHLERFATDVFVEVFEGEQLRFQTLLHAKKTQFSLTKPSFSLRYYLQLGIKHVLTGMDHILFLLGILIVLGMFQAHQEKPYAIKALMKHGLTLMSVFTVSHGISLLLSVYNIIQLPRLSVEAIIALSLVFLASQQLKKEGAKLNGLYSLGLSRNTKYDVSFSKKCPHLHSVNSGIFSTKALSLVFRDSSSLVFGFGLVHGFGFSGALLDIGFNASSQFLAVLLFNVGIELGQILLGVPALFVLMMMMRYHQKLFFYTAKASFYVIGSVGMFFFLKRFFLMLSA